MQGGAKFRNRYRIESVRLKGCDYSQDGMYFVTICTQDREDFFGKIINEKMELNVIGHIADKCWQEIPAHFPHVNIDEYIIMPNHVHGIIEIDWDNTTHVGTQNFASEMSDMPIVDMPIVETQNFASEITETQNFASLRGTDKPYQNKFGPQSKNLSSIIRGYKIGVKKYATINKINFTWQPRFYDCIIRNEQSLSNIRYYIVNNPAKWEMDRNNMENIWM